MPRYTPTFTDWRGVFDASSVSDLGEGEMPVTFGQIREMLLPGLRDVATDYDPYSIQLIPTCTTTATTTAVGMGGGGGGGAGFGAGCVVTWVDVDATWGEVCPTPAPISGALKKSKKLLVENLTPAQLKSFAIEDYFEVKGSRTRKTYRIHCNIGGPNVDVMAMFGVAKRICFGPKEHLPRFDKYLIQKVALEVDEDSVLAVANEW